MNFSIVGSNRSSESSSGYGRWYWRTSLTRSSAEPKSRPRRNLLGHCRIVRPGSATASTLCARWLSIAVDAKPAADVVRKPDTMGPVPIGWCRLWPELLTPPQGAGFDQFL